jgi:hypothetical protein
MSWRSVIVAACLIATPVSAQLTVTCPPGSNGEFNVNKLGCTLCVESNPECSVFCQDVPVCICTGDLATCCAKNPLLLELPRTKAAAVHAEAV